MEIVADDDGRRYVLEQRSSDAWLVRSIATGDAEYRDPAALSVLEDASPLSVAADGVPESLRTVLTAVHDERALGLLLLVVDRDAVGVRELLDATTLCESDLHGALGELTAADLLTETTVAGERGYEATDRAIAAAEQLRSD